MRHVMRHVGASRIDIPAEPDRIRSLPANSSDSRPRCNVTLQNVLDRLKRYLRSGRPSTPERGRFTAEEARENRASSVTALQREVRRLQQEITDLNAVQESGTAAGDATANASRMTALQDELARKQRELATYQARV
jgi:hypothetical protein